MSSLEYETIECFDMERIMIELMLLVICLIFASNDTSLFVAYEEIFNLFSILYVLELYYICCGPTDELCFIKTAHEKAFSGDIRALSFRDFYLLLKILLRKPNIGTEYLKGRHIRVVYLPIAFN